MRFPRFAAVGGAMALTVASLIVPAEAASASDHVENVSESIARLAPPVGSPVRVHVRDGVLVADSGSATLPLTGSGRLQIVNGKQDRPGLIDLPDVTLSLPSEAGVATARASVSNNGTVVYRGTRSVDVLSLIHISEPTRPY